MIYDFRLLGVLSDGLVRIETTGTFRGEVARDLWTRAKARKRTRCAVTDLEIAPGDDVFLPIGNQSYRSLRITPYGIKVLADRTKADR